MDETTLKKELQDLNKPTSQVLEEYKKQAVSTLPDEIGIKHPSQDVGIHIRDDGSLELFAGTSRILLDGTTGTIVLAGNHLVSSTMDINFNLASVNSLGINNSALNIQWLSNSPTMLKDQKAKFLTGSPGQGQTSKEFSSVFSSKKLFIPPDTSFLSSLSELLKGVV